MKGIEPLFPVNTNLLGTVYTEQKLERIENCKKCENRKSGSNETTVKFENIYISPLTFTFSNNNISG